MTLRAAVVLGVTVATLAGCEKKADPPAEWVDAGVLCTDPSSRALIEAWLADAGPEAGPLSDPGVLTAFDCGREPECLGALYNDRLDAGIQCVDNCMMPTVAGDLSQGCRYCYIYYGLLCAGFYCLNECVATNEGCEPCFQEHCEVPLDHCLGF